MRCYKNWLYQELWASLLRGNSCVRQEVPLPLQDLIWLLFIHVPVHALRVFRHFQEDFNSELIPSARYTLKVSRCYGNETAVEQCGRFSANSSGVACKSKKALSVRCTRGECAGRDGRNLSAPITKLPSVLVWFVRRLQPHMTSKPVSVNLESQLCNVGKFFIYDMRLLNTRSRLRMRAFFA